MSSEERRKLALKTYTDIKKRRAARNKKNEEDVIWCLVENKQKCRGKKVRQI